MLLGLQVEVVASEDSLGAAAIGDVSYSQQIPLLEQDPSTPPMECSEAVDTSPPVAPDGD